VRGEVVQKEGAGKKSSFCPGRGKQCKITSDNEIRYYRGKSREESCRVVSLMVKVPLHPQSEGNNRI
jgi:hypothetical protein